LNLISVIISLETSGVTSPGCFNKLNICNSKYPCFTTILSRTLKNSEEILYGVSEGDCVRICLEAQRNCRSISYDRKTRTCNFSKYTRKNRPSDFVPLPGGRYFEKKASCRSECILAPFPGFRLKGSEIRTIPTLNDLECIAACLQMKPDGICLSIDRNRFTKLCTLHNKRRQSEAASFIASNGFSYWDLECQEDDFPISGDESGCDALSCSNDDDICEPKDCDSIPTLDCREDNVECDSSRSCFEEFNKKHLIFNDIREFPSNNRTACKTACLFTPGCKSSEYDRVKMKCYISKESSKTKPFDFRDHGNVVYWERRDTCAVNCFLVQLENSFLGGFNWKKLHVKNNLQCMTFCLSDDNCFSADFNKKTKICYLSKENLFTQRFRLRRNNNYDFWLKRCRSEVPCFVAMYNRKLANRENQLFEGVTERECARLCLERHCRSFNYEVVTRVCFLSLFTRRNFPFLYMKSEGVIYMEKKDSCRPDCFYKRIESSTRLDSFSEDISFPSKTAEDCFEECLEKAEVCRAVEFDNQEKTCKIDGRLKPRQNIESQPFDDDGTRYIYWKIEC